MMSVLFIGLFLSLSVMAEFWASSSPASRVFLSCTSCRVLHDRLAVDPCRPDVVVERLDRAPQPLQQAMTTSRTDKPTISV